MNTTTIGRAVLRTAIPVLVALALVAQTGGSAQAISPTQTKARATLKLLGHDQAGSIFRFWEKNFDRWNLAYETPDLYVYNGSYGDYRTGCGSTREWHENAFFCETDNAIYFDIVWAQELLENRGDYFVGGLLAHEWGHAIAWTLDWDTSNVGNELFADCLSGMYTNWGYETGRLTGRDYDEFRGWLRSRTWSRSHGSGRQRAAWFDYGYEQYDINDCARAYG